MSAYRAYQVTGQRNFGLVEPEIAWPGTGQVRIRVHDCGVCHSDVPAVAGQRPDPTPVVPGHEMVGANEDNLAFSAANSIAPMNEVIAFEDAPRAYERMMSGHARFRVVLEIAEAP